MPLTTIESEGQIIKIINSGNKVVVFMGSQGCGHCIQIKPLFEKLAKQYPNIDFAYIEASKLRPYIEKMGLQGFPTFYSYLSGNKIGEVIGASQSELQHLVSSLNTKKQQSLQTGSSIVPGYKTQQQPQIQPLPRNVDRQPYQQQQQQRSPQQLPLQRRLPPQQQLPQLEQRSLFSYDRENQYPQKQYGSNQMNRNGYQQQYQSYKGRDMQNRGIQYNMDYEEQQYTPTQRPRSPRASNPNRRYGY